MPDKPTESKKKKRAAQTMLPAFSDAYELDAHRDFLTEMGRIIAGKREITREEGYILAYRAPSYRTVARWAASRRTDFGQLDVSEGHLVARQPGGGEIPVVTLDDPDEAMEFLTSALHIIHTRRRELAMPASADLQRQGQPYSSPGGAKGHLLKEYDLLIEQLMHEYHYQRQRPRDEWA